MNLITKKIIKACSHYGPGGRNCTCCGPAPKIRKKHDRSVKRSMKQDMKKEINYEKEMDSRV